MGKAIKNWGSRNSSQNGGFGNLYSNLLAKVKPVEGMQTINPADVTQAMVDAGEVQWDRSMLEGKDPIRPPIGMGNAPARMPEWAKDMVQSRSAADLAPAPKYVAANSAPLAEALREAAKPPLPFSDDGSGGR